MPPQTAYQMSGSATPSADSHDHDTLFDLKFTASFTAPAWRSGPPPGISSADGAPKLVSLLGTPEMKAPTQAFTTENTELAVKRVKDRGLRQSAHGTRAVGERLLG